MPHISSSFSWLMRNNPGFYTQEDIDNEEESSSDDNDGGNGGSEKRTRAQRKRLRRKKLKEAASRRRKIIGPLLPGSDDANVEVVCNVPESVRQNAATDGSGDILYSSFFIISLSENYVTIESYEHWFS